jgi:catechol 2,3-dioxygenase-like lactoylglutathione lyase family enzyme
MKVWPAIFTSPNLRCFAIAWQSGSRQMLTNSGDCAKIARPTPESHMSARINHVAITSDYYAMNARFYESLFGMRPAKKSLPPSRAISLGDGYVGMTHIPRRDGRTSGLDHFGIEVDDIEDTIARIQKFDGQLSALKRPPIRPYAAYSSHDPDTNIFDLSQRHTGFQRDVYAENTGEEVRTRSIDHISLRTRNAERCGHFYAEVFGLALMNRPSDGNFYLTDGRVTLAIIQWKLSDYYGMDPARLGLDHIGFRVENVDAVKRDLDFLTGENPHLRGRALGYGSEGEARLALFKQCPFGEHHFTDIEGVYLDVSCRDGN